MITLTLHPAAARQLAALLTRVVPAHAGEEALLALVVELLERRLDDEAPAA